MLLEIFRDKNFRIIVSVHKVYEQCIIKITKVNNEIIESFEILLEDVDDLFLAFDEHNSRCKHAIEMVVEENYVKIMDKNDDSNQISVTFKMFEYLRNVLLMYAKTINH